MNKKYFIKIGVYYLVQILISTVFSLFNFENLVIFVFGILWIGICVSLGLNASLISREIFNEMEKSVVLNKYISDVFPLLNRLPNTLKLSKILKETKSNEKKVKGLLSKYNDYFSQLLFFCFTQFYLFFIIALLSEIIKSLLQR